MSTDMDKVIHIKLQVELGLIMMKLSPVMHHKYIRMGNGEAVLYVKPSKVLYIRLRSALLLYKRLVEDLESVGFELNPYDTCVTSKKINGEKFTVVWHVDDLKVPHKEPKEVTKLLE